MEGRWFVGAVVVAGLLGCNERGSVQGVDRASAREAFMQRLELPGHVEPRDGALPDGNDPAVEVVPVTGSPRVVVPGDPLWLDVSFRGPDVVGVNVSFGGQSHLYVPVDDPESGTVSVAATIKPEVCDDLYDICHQIACYEQVVTSEGTFSKAQAQQLVLDCSDDGCGDAAPLPPDTCPGGCPSGQICLRNTCVDRSTETSCALRAPRCCPGHDDSCTGQNAACYCDEFCVEAGDCCSDACSECGYCL